MGQSAIGTFAIHLGADLSRSTIPSKIDFRVDPEKDQIKIEGLTEKDFQKVKAMIDDQRLLHLGQSTKSISGKSQEPLKTFPNIATKFDKDKASITLDPNANIPISPIKTGSSSDWVNIGATKKASSLLIETNEGNDKVSYSGSKDSANNDGFISVDTGKGDDIVMIKNQSKSDAKIVINTGEGSDRVELNLKNLNKAPIVNMGGYEQQAKQDLLHVTGNGRLLLLSESINQKPPHLIFEDDANKKSYSIELPSFKGMLELDFNSTNIADKKTIQGDLFNDNKLSNLNLAVQELK